MDLHKFGPNDVKLTDPNTGEWCVVDRTTAILLQCRGLAHWGEEGLCLGDGVNWRDVEDELAK